MILTIFILIFFVAATAWTVQGLADNIPVETYHGLTSWTLVVGGGAYGLCIYDGQLIIGSFSWLYMGIVIGGAWAVLTWIRLAQKRLV